MVFGFKKRAQTEQTASQTHKASTKALWSRFKGQFSRSQQQLGERLATLCLGKKQLDDDLLEAIETQLLTADVGVSATEQLLTQLTEKCARAELDDTHNVFEHLRAIMLGALRPCQAPLTIPTHAQHTHATQPLPFTILMVGINGAGKTTTLGKLAHHFRPSHKVLLAAGDTYRAAAVEQLQTWGDRCQVPVITHGGQADSAAVIFDAMQAAQARGCDVLLADTAGRLHTQDQLMQELSKIKRVMHKANPEAPHEVLLVLDASIGQNALQQVAAFQESIGVTGLVITKLDGTAKGGILWAIAQQFSLPIRFVGIGEGIDDLAPFDAEQWIHTILDHPPGNTP